MQLHRSIGREADIQLSKSDIGGGSYEAIIIITSIIKSNTNVNLFSGRVRTADRFGVGTMIVWLNSGPQCGPYWCDRTKTVGQTFLSASAREGRQECLPHCFSMGEVLQDSSGYSTGRAGRTFQVWIFKGMTPASAGIMAVRL